MPLPVLTTDRLILRAMQRADAIWLAELLGDPEVRRLTLQPAMNPWKEHAIAYLSVLRDPNCFAIEERSSGTPIGLITVSALPPASNPAVAFELRRAFWNRGYTTEALHALLNYAFAHGQSAFSGIAFIENRASQRVFEKSGFTCLGECFCFAHRSLLYEVRQEEFLRFHLQQPRSILAQDRPLVGVA
jgi:RimJ/RimL family protein N-acetyltransferase